mmetsp:Transcript_25665/g.64660  ORF Transcript_25665/g.64660 Transcript_25665/m.64660 type:complete len:153 (+) Transcript_25665:937-1395(+)|eukprot:g5817.t1
MTLINVGNEWMVGNFIAKTTEEIKQELWELAQKIQKIKSAAQQLKSSGASTPEGADTQEMGDDKISGQQDEVTLKEETNARILDTICSGYKDLLKGVSNRPSGDAAMIASYDSALATEGGIAEVQKLIQKAHGIGLEAEVPAPRDLTCDGFF